MKYILIYTYSTFQFARVMFQVPSSHMQLAATDGLCCSRPFMAMTLLTVSLWSFSSCGFHWLQFVHLPSHLSNLLAAPTVHYQALLYSLPSVAPKVRLPIHMAFHQNADDTHIHVSNQASPLHSTLCSLVPHPLSVGYASPQSSRAYMIWCRLPNFTPLFPWLAGASATLAFFSVLETGSRLILSWWFCTSFLHCLACSSYVWFLLI